LLLLQPHTPLLPTVRAACSSLVHRPIPGANLDGGPLPSSRGRRRGIVIAAASRSAPAADSCTATHLGAGRQQRYMWTMSCSWRSLPLQRCNLLCSLPPGRWRPHRSGGVDLSGSIDSRRCSI
jgi:hypothetical protein